MPDVKFLLYRPVSGGTWQVTASETPDYPTVSLPAGDYEVIGGDGVASTTHTVPELTVTITGAIEVGETLTAISNASETASYQWALDGSDIAGATGDSHTAATAGGYTLTVTDGQQTVTSPAATVMYPALTVAIGGIARLGETLTAISNGSAQTSYQWALDGVAIAGATGENIVVAAEGGYTVTVFDAGNEAISDIVDVQETAAWTPAALTALRGWWDASDISTVSTASGTVTEWRDKSGYVNADGAQMHAVPEFATGPGTVTIGGRNALDIGTDQALVFPTPDIADADSRSVMIVLGDHHQTATRALFALGAAGDGNRWSLVETRGVLSLEWNGGKATSQVDALGAGLVGNFHSGATVGGWSFSRNGTHVTGVTSDGTALSTFPNSGWIGRKSQASSGHAMGPVGEVILTAAEMTQSEREKCEGYLAHKWGFAALLPDHHPFKDAAPTE